MVLSIYTESTTSYCSVKIHREHNRVLFIQDTQRAQQGTVQSRYKESTTWYSSVKIIDIEVHIAYFST